MNAVIGDILPLALGIAVSPVPIIAAILMLLSPKAQATSIGFFLGWVTGIVAAVTIFTLLSSLIPEESDDAKPFGGTLKIVLGVLLLVMAFRQWRSRPAAGADPPLPKWMSSIDTLTAGKAFGLGALLSGVNPKNLLLSAGAGLIIGPAGLSAGNVVVVILVFTVIAAITVALPVIAYLVAPARMGGPLDRLRTWLVHNNATIMSVLLLVLGVVVIGKGVGSF